MVIVALVLLAVRALSSGEVAAAPTTASSSTTTTAPVATMAPDVTTTSVDTTTTFEAATTTTTTRPPVPAGPQLGALQVNDIPATTAGYSRDLFPSWLDLDGNGCDTRQEVLLEEAEGPVQRDPYGDCATVIAGDWTSIYDGRHVTDPSELDVDHLVPLAEAWRSGAHAWEPERRALFANHLDEPDHLIAVTASTNRSKSDSPPDEWRPPVEASWCRYATAWVRVKVTWGLTATTVERDALGQMLNTC